VDPGLAVGGVFDLAASQVDDDGVGRVSVLSFARVDVHPRPDDADLVVLEDGPERHAGELRRTGLRGRRRPRRAPHENDHTRGEYEKLSHRAMLQEMEYRRLGSTGLKISRLGLGCGNFGGIGSAPAFFGMGETEEQARDLMDRAFDAGINFFDTANAYGGGRSETYIGRWLKAKGPAVRQQLLLSSKVFNPIGPGPNDQGLSRRHILQQIDASLARLQTDRLDMYLIHEPDPDTPLDTTRQA